MFKRKSSTRNEVTGYDVACSLMAQVGISDHAEPADLTEAARWNSLLGQIINGLVGRGEPRDLPKSLKNEIFIYSSLPKLQVEDILLMLEERQTELRASLRRLSNEEQAAEIIEVVKANVDDPQVQQQISEAVSASSKRQAELDIELRAQEESAARELRKAEAHERKWKVRWSLLQREPVAVLVGALLLVGFSIVLVVAMWTHTAVPEVVVNMLLLILGFFFGQTTSGRSKASE
ncbi:hypothetical protein ACFXG4_04160 [Nocardia sp. NPDC059246]|uniref:hypothetical protein n=1 Tax=unclassified Nocardia TaxID=2637762 RepID=UPI0036B3C6CB